MGNAKARRLYEAFLPECFQRPETDHAAEIFIRDKYEKKKYIVLYCCINSIDFSQKKYISPKTDSQAVTDLLGLGILNFLTCTSFICVMTILSYLFSEKGSVDIMPLH